MIKKRMFFGAEMHAPWPREFPEGRLLKEESRHLTLAFLGTTEWEPLEALLPNVPKPSFEVGLSGVCDQLLFLPEKNPRVVAAHIEWMENKETFLSYQKTLSAWLIAQGYPLKDTEFCSHITFARAPFDPTEWLAAFSPLPIVFSALHLYESVGNLTYVPLWTFPLILPFEDLEHTADIAFLIRGETYSSLLLHAQIALAFKFPLLTSFILRAEVKDLDDVVIALNRLITIADAEIGVPFKAVSFHRTLRQTSYLEWEMIVDV